MSAQENKRYPLLLSFWVWKVTMTSEVPMTDEEIFDWFSRLSDLLLTDTEFLEWMDIFQQEVDYEGYVWLEFLDRVKELFELVRSGDREDLRAKLEADMRAEKPEEYDDGDVAKYFERYAVFMAGEELLLKEEGAESSHEDDAACSEEDEEHVSEFFDDELDSGGESSDEDDPAYSEEDVDDYSMCSDDEYDDDYPYEDEDYGSDDGIQYDEYEESGVDLFF